VVPGKRNHLLRFIMRRLPAPLYRSLAIKYARDTGRDRPAPGPSH
jgi:hypothetical protein